MASFSQGRVGILFLSDPAAVLQLEHHAVQQLSLLAVLPRGLLAGLGTQRAGVTLAQSLDELLVGRLGLLLDCFAFLDLRKTVGVFFQQRFLTNRG